MFWVGVKKNSSLGRCGPTAHLAVRRRFAPSVGIPLSFFLSIFWLKTNKQTNSNLWMNYRLTVPLVEEFASCTGTSWADTYAAPTGHILVVVYPLLIFIPDEEFHSSVVTVKEHFENGSDKPQQTTRIEMPDRPSDHFWYTCTDDEGYWSVWGLLKPSGRLAS